MKIKNKKIFWGIVVVTFLMSSILIYLFKPMTMNDIYDKPNFAGEVIDVSDKSILVSVNKDEDEIKSSDKISVSLDVKLKDSITNFKVGDKVRVFYDGVILESYPAQIHTVYAILLID
ncbi:DUF3221 domain-containing protein [Clostridium sp. AL.422]|uniref:DUF3221 domain-containing protein n=1 Tax=Clostridium TaxID=1485 RepID=UPI00293DE53A|nr:MULTISPECIES: DUF3221 domain-containing protein [unclassified Clostridium]MDV4150237.1 DUF3221 domain-containing protein [Clostridium sp. AL.422]